MYFTWKKSTVRDSTKYTVCHCHDIRMSKKVFYGLTLLTWQQSGHSVHSAVVKIWSTSHTDITVITLRHSLWCLLERLLWTLWCIVNTVVLGAEMKHFKTVNNELHKKKPWCQYFLLNKGSVHLCWYDNKISSVYGPYM